MAVAALLMVQACGKRLQIAEGCANGFYETTSGQRLVWPDGSHVNFSIDKSVPESFEDAILASGDAYSENLLATKVKVDKETPVPSFNGDTSKLEEDGVNGVYWLNDEQWLWQEEKKGAIAVTVTTFASSRITGADIYFRASAFERTQRKAVAETQITSAKPFSATGLIPALSNAALPLVELLNTAAPFRSTTSNNTLVSAAYDPSSANKNYPEHHVYMVSVHEIGHALGRCHSSEPASIMFPTVGSGTEQMRKAPLDEIDIDIFASAYALFAD